MNDILSNDSSLSEIHAFLLRAHYHLMDNPRFWYENGLKDASRILCSIASEMNLQLLKEKNNGN